MLPNIQLMMHVSCGPNEIDDNMVDIYASLTSGCHHSHD